MQIHFLVFETLRLVEGMCTFKLQKLFARV